MAGRKNRSREKYVQKLRDRFGIPRDEDIIEYSAIDKVLGFPRFVTCEKRGRTFGKRLYDQTWNYIVKEWKRELYVQHNVFMKSILNVGYEVLNPEKRINHAGFRFKVHMTGLANTHELVRMTDLSALGPIHRAKAMQLMSVISHITALAQKHENRVKRPNTRTRNSLS